MNCKHCQAEMDEQLTVCPACGKSQEEPQAEAVEAPEVPVEAPAETPAPQTEMKPGMSGGKLALFVIGCVVLFAIVVGLVMGGVQRDIESTSGEPGETAAPTEANPEETVVYTVPADGEAGTPAEKGTYTVSDEEAAAANAVVVATVGEEQLTNGQLQAYYWAEVMNFAQQYGSYASYFGLDFEVDLAAQPCPLYEEELAMTWQQHFLQTALEGWNTYVALNQESVANGFVPEAEFEEYLEQLPQSLEDSAASAGAASVEELIHEVSGKGCTVQDYMDYVVLYNKAYLYYNHCYEQLDPTDAEVEAYYTENLAYFNELGVYNEPTPTMSVRHILLEPENGVTDETGYYMTYSDEDWAACEQKAQALLDQWLAEDGTEAGFAALAQEHSIDGGSSSNGGLYEGLTAETNFVEEFKAWYMDESRQPGDTGLVKSVYGYHIMYFSGSEAVESWRDTVREELINEQISALIPALLEKYPMTVDYSAIVLAYVDLMGE